MNPHDIFHFLIIDKFVFLYWNFLHFTFILLCGVQRWILFLQLLFVHFNLLFDLYHPHVYFCLESPSHILYFLKDFVKLLLILATILQHPVSQLRSKEIINRLPLVPFVQIWAVCTEQSMADTGLIIGADEEHRFLMRGARFDAIGHIDRLPGSRATFKHI